MRRLVEEEQCILKLLLNQQRMCEEDLYGVVDAMGDRNCDLHLAPHLAAMPNLRKERRRGEGY
jgi:hypothetical protein